jgi:hypothetical protein
MYIIKNTSNTVVVTLTEKATITNHDWLFEFSNGLEGSPKKYCSAVDISLYPERYNEFVIIDGPVEDPANGTLNFTPTGSWDYKVYEMPVSSPPALVPTGYLAICETGSLKVFDSTETVKIPFVGDNVKSNKVFKG